MNIDLGDHVPLAPVGAVLPGGFEIALRQMRASPPTECCVRRVNWDSATTITGSCCLMK